MKKILVFALLSLFVLGVTGTAKAVVLLPGSTASAVTGAPVPAGTFVTTITAPFITSTGSFSGVVTQNVYLNSTGYLFTYLWSNDARSLDSIARMTASDFTGFVVDADAVGVPGEDVPHLLSRSSGGNSIGFQHSGGAINDEGVDPGHTSAVEWIQTNAQFYGPGFNDYIDGGVAEVKLYGPAAVPEPASMVLLGMGVLGLFGLKRKSRLSV